MTRGLNREVLRLAVPSILANITVPLVGMVDLAVAGHLGTDSGSGAAPLIAALAIGTMLFDLLYWNFGFLRISTGGLTAQAFGRGDEGETANLLLRSFSTAAALSLVVILLQGLVIRAAFLVVDCSPEVRELAIRYFRIRVLAAPATLGLFALKGWFIGMQDSVSPMVTDVVVNVVNVVASIALGLGFGPLGGAAATEGLTAETLAAGISSAGAWGFRGMGIAGIALGTVIAQYLGLLTAGAFILFRYRRHLAGRISAQAAFRKDRLREFFSLGGQLVVRSLCFLAIYEGYTIFAARYGDLMLASSAIMMKVLMLFSYITDGFAYAGEALTGKYIGMKDPRALRDTVLLTFGWSMAIAVGFMFVYGFAGVPILRVMTSDGAVVQACRAFLPWLLLMPVFGCAAFTWDGIFIGATAGSDIRNVMMLAAASFFAVYLAGHPIIRNMGGPAGIHLLMLAYFAHLLARTLYLTLRFRRSVLSKIE